MKLADKFNVTPITFKAKIVYYPSTHSEKTTIGQCSRILESGEFDIECVEPFDLEPTYIIKPKSYK